MAFDSPRAEVTQKAEELDGQLSSQSDEDKLMHLVMEHDTDAVEDGLLASAAVSHGFSFTPELAFDKLVHEYALTERLYGESVVRLLSGYSASYLKRNIRIPEFQRELKKKLTERYEHLRKDGLISKDGSLTPKALELAAIVLYVQEIEHLFAKGQLGTKASRHPSVYGDLDSWRSFRKADRYRDLDLKRSVSNAIRRLHTQIEPRDLSVRTRTSKGRIELVYAIDASGSMMGKKLEMAKRAGIALAFMALRQKDAVGLLVFGSQVRDAVAPTSDFLYLLQSIADVRAHEETNIIATLEKSIELFSSGQLTRHLLLLTDALPTIGTTDDTLAAVARVQAAGITVSVVGISLDKEGRQTAERIAELGKGRLYLARKLEELDTIVLQDYYATA